MSCLLTVFLVLPILSTVSWASSPEEIQLAVDGIVNCETQKMERAVEHFERVLQRMEQELETRNPRRTKKQTLWLRNRMKEIEQHLKTIKSMPVTPILSLDTRTPVLRAFSMQVGSCGVLDKGDRYVVFQVIDENRFLVIPETIDSRLVPDGYGSRRIGGSNAWTSGLKRSSYKTRGEPFLVAGVSTAGLTDEKRMWLPRPFLVSGTYSYASVGGARKTVLQLIPVDLEKVAAALKQLSATKRVPFENRR